MVDATNIGNWQRTGDKKLARPTPIPRPGGKPKPRPLTAAEKQALNARLGWK